MKSLSPTVPQPCGGSADGTGNADAEANAHAASSSAIAAMPVVCLQRDEVTSVRTYEYAL